MNEEIINLSKRLDEVERQLGLVKPNNLCKTCYGSGILQYEQYKYYCSKCKGKGIDVHKCSTNESSHQFCSLAFPGKL